MDHNGLSGIRTVVPVWESDEKRWQILSWEKKILITLRWYAKVMQKVFSHNNLKLIHWTKLVTIVHSVVIDCDNFGKCSQTCGGGEQTCERTCQHGSWGDPGCPTSQLRNRVACNEQPCPAQPSFSFYYIVFPSRTSFDTHFPIIYFLLRTLCIKNVNS